VRASEQEQTGGAGISEVSAKFQRMGWGPVPNTQHDLGTDLFVQARDARRFDRGLFVGVQVKAGASWFADPVYAQDGSLSGWWYYEPRIDHFDDWVRHGLPHLLVLHDLDKHVSYWVHVRAEAVDITGKGAKILVPVVQTIDLEHFDDLLAVAATHKPVIGLEGTAWTTGAAAVPPGNRLRYALLVPRLVAPHPNASHANPIGPEEGVALLAQGRVRDLEIFAEQHMAVPQLAEAESSRDWRWRFVHALGRLVTEGEAAALGERINDAPTVSSRIAACVVKACALLDAERHGEAVELLSAHTDEADPVDLAWLLTQRGRARAEIGQVSTARADASAAQRALVGDSDDVTASAIGAAAAWLLFETAAWGEQRLEDIVAAGDTAVSWWRSQTLSWALTEAVDDAFRQWADDRSVRFLMEDTVNNQLFAALINAHFTGEQVAWRAIGGVLAPELLTWK